MLFTNILNKVCEPALSFLRSMAISCVFRSTFHPAPQNCFPQLCTPSSSWVWHPPTAESSENFCRWHRLELWSLWMYKVKWEGHRHSSLGGPQTNSALPQTQLHLVGTSPGQTNWGMVWTEVRSSDCRVLVPLQKLWHWHHLHTDWNELSAAT